MSERPGGDDEPSPPSATDIFAPTAAETPAVVLDEEPASATPDPDPPEPAERDPEPEAASAGDTPPPIPTSPGGGTQVFVSASVRDTGRLTRLLPDGEVETLDFDDEVVVGSAEGGMRIPDDPYLSPRHARVRREGRVFILEDLDSVNGTFLRIDGSHELEADDRVMLGSQLFEFRASPAPTLVHLDADGEPGETHELGDGETAIGREEGDLVFGDDPLMSGLHARIRVEDSAGDAAVVIRDERSRNGIYVLARGPHELSDGAQFTVGKQVVRFELRHPPDPLKRVS
ncbi:MAG: FHA domain-containing protein [Gemmatimonadota bacterium]|nr:FHA domain-containing protein [Gemmatimonadota bacterium]